MYRGRPPTTSSSVGDPPRAPSSPPRAAAAMLVDMSRLSTTAGIPSISSGPHPPSFAPFSSCHGSTGAAAQPEIVPPANHHHQPRDSEGVHGNAHQLPSLRTLLDPQLLGPRHFDPSPQSAAGNPPSSHSSGRYASSSPTLKRRHDFDGYSHDRSEVDGSFASRTPPLRLHATRAEPQHFSTPSAASTPGPRTAEFALQSHPLHPSIVGSNSTTTTSSNISNSNRGFRPSSTVSAGVSVSTEHSGHHGSIHHGPYDGPLELAKARRRTEGAPRMGAARTSRYLGQREIPGEGLCYVYDDGSYLRTVIDGEPVNPNWGVTKAGKPRKRLAQACLTCREKKIKCEPGYPKCQQCAKSQRLCKGGLNQAGAAAAGEEATRPLSSSSTGGLLKKLPPDPISPLAGPDYPPPHHRALDEPRDAPTTAARSADVWGAGPSQKLRSVRSNKRPFEPRGMSVHSFDTDWSGSLNEPDPDDPRRGTHQDQLAYQWEQDPHEGDAQLTLDLLDLYFRHAGRAMYGIFPQRPFVAWVQNQREKTQDDRMLLYSVLAMGSVFSADQDHQSIGRHFAAVAAYATEKRFGRFTLQLCQSRLVLALYNFARGKSTQAWDFCGAGLRAISALRLNTEAGIKELAEDAPPEYGFDQWTLEECCRRTFWSGFLMDRYNGFCGGTLCVISPEDTFLRLPCAESAYEESVRCETPLFQPDLLHGNVSPETPNLGLVAYLTLLSAIWGEVLTFTSRAAHRPDEGYERNYESFYGRIYEQLSAWEALLPGEYRYSLQNLDLSLGENYGGTFLSLHALYHTTVMRLNRNTRATVLSPESLHRNIHRTVRSATEFLHIMSSLGPSHRQQRVPGTDADALVANPFPGYALMLSIDVLSACGTFETLPAFVNRVLGAAVSLDELAPFWASARAQQKAITNRVKQLENLRWREEQGVRNGSLGEFWKLSDPLEKAFGNEDLVYKVPDEVLFPVVAEYMRG